MNRLNQAKERMSKLFNDTELSISKTDPDFSEIVKNFIYGDVYSHVELTDKERELITVVVLITNQTLGKLKRHIKGTLNIGLSPVEIKEALYQCAPYIGISKVLEALDATNEVFAEMNISLPLENQKEVTEDNRFDKGLKVQKSIFGDVIDKMHENTPDNQKHIKKYYLSAMCFGDFYTRGGLDVKMRELLTFSILCALGGCESQLKAHVAGNLSVGNDKEILLLALTQCIPYIGYPRTLNALACINEVISAEEKN
ncbi:carboxymuconolactone decarboxylase family protein [Orenia marismortui]|uniref:4-carboxymuconolactone decarboxylase n=1 Tax=Orenia marismortui TaxID=46469 RepID=A0A4R8H148_9FIRM|nr:carboxymuconolactone decarboxylase family protein [Orenia marismortui]TDX53227.1 4-carboxymuconolactone decarboxylase [Orenia marismortui]